MLYIPGAFPFPRRRSSDPADIKCAERDAPRPRRHRDAGSEITLLPLSDRGVSPRGHAARAGHHFSHRKQAVMAGRILNRRELRRQSDAAESARSAGAEGEVEAVEEDEEEAEEGEEAAEGSQEEGDEEAPATKTKAKAKPKAARKARKPKAPPRMRARWGVF